MTTYFGEEIQIGDWVVWTPCKACLDYGQVVGFTPKGYLRVRVYSIGLKVFLEPLRIVKTKAVVRAKLTCIP
ncbi:MAG: hypothetical protein EKK63_02505 [Acinetobacter sp.]|uniref:hypothetical protein n=1 Tax=Acinetobacter sp. TaxID=472 RepID=UPI000F9A0BDA|nr:hypothetical protein [Acinetobacter sp.]RUP42188.1 MAG: hypothetical protein EKK63_02505 [Acinetobacter sp.]